jgi:amino acid adenylation domain-containing protein
MLAYNEGALDSSPAAGSAASSANTLLLPTGIGGTSGTAKFEITLDLGDGSDGGLDAGLEFSTDLFQTATIERMAEHLQVLLRSIVDSPDEPLSMLRLMSTTEEQLITIPDADRCRAFWENQIRGGGGKAMPAPPELPVIAKKQGKKVGTAGTEADKESKSASAAAASEEVAAVAEEATVQVATGGLGADEWATLRARCNGKLGASAGAGDAAGLVLLTAFAQVLARWSTTKRFSLGVRCMAAGAGAAGAADALVTIDAKKRLYSRKRGVIAQPVAQDSGSGNPHDPSLAVFAQKLSRQLHRVLLHTHPRVGMAELVQELGYDQGEEKLLRVSFSAVATDRSTKEEQTAAGGTAGGGLFAGWLPVRAEAVTLLMFHYAGGNANSFDGWAQSDEFKRVPGLVVIPVELPGHGSRRSKQALEDLPELLELLVHELAPAIKDCRYCVLGYSFGSLLAYEFALKMSAIGHPPQHLFACSEAAPSKVEPDVDPDLEEGEFVRLLQKFNMIQNEIVEAGPDIWQVVLPSYRCDLRLEKQYSWDPAVKEGRLQCPVTAVAGRQDEGLQGPGVVEEWSRVSAGTFALHWVDGPHMFMHETPVARQTLLEVVASGVEKAMVGSGVSTTIHASSSTDQAASDCSASASAGASTCASAAGGYQLDGQDLDIIVTDSGNAGGLSFEVRGNPAIIPAAVVQGVHRSYQHVLDKLANDPDGGLFEAPMSMLLTEAAKVPPIGPDFERDRRLMHVPYLEAAQRQPEAVAIVDGSSSPSREISYAEVEHMSRAVTSRLVSELHSKGPMEARVVAMVMYKSWKQVVAVQAILRLGGTYLPLDAKMPQSRLEQVIEMSGAVAVLSETAVISKEGGEGEWLKELSVPTVNVDDLLSAEEGVRSEVEVMEAGALEEAALALCGGKVPESRSMAYLIYTSGSTGVPKGVCCHHEGAMNTCVDLNGRFDVGSNDRTLALSSMSFDLSVYDVFGMGAAGGAIVIPAADTVSPPDPERWLQLVESEQVTLWNTVPAFMEMMVSYAEHAGRQLPACLRMVWMSGDWIPLSLPPRIRACAANKDIRVISMGGATEAAVWSNTYEIPREIDADWTSIPYGVPMRNQTMYILDGNLDHCEPLVTGVIYIGGAGTALGYYKDERSKKQFFSHPVTGEWVFRTGDLGRVRADGLLEILGREDSQVKVNGFRVELGEVDKTIGEHEAVCNCLTVVHLNALLSYVELKPGSADPVDSSWSQVLRKFAAATLPDYMLPKQIMLIEEMPLSANGKIERKRLPKPTVGGAGEDGGYVAPTGDDGMEALLCQCFAAVLGGGHDPSGKSISAAASFFDLGGDSLSALRLLVAIAEATEVEISIPSLFTGPNAQDIAVLIRKDLARKARKAAAGGADAEAEAEEDDPADWQIQLMPLHVHSPTVPPAPPAEVASGESWEPLVEEVEAVAPPLFLVHPAGTSALCYRPLATTLHSSSPTAPSSAPAPASAPSPGPGVPNGLPISIFALEDRTLNGRADFSDPSATHQSIVQVARQCAALIRRQLHDLDDADPAREWSLGPCIVGGWSYGGVVALEAAAMLEDEGVMVELVTLFDAPLRVDDQEVIRHLHTELQHTMYGVACKNRRHRGSTYEQAATGKDIVEWMLRNSYASGRANAVAVGCRMLAAGLVRHAVKASGKDGSSASGAGGASSGDRNLFKDQDHVLYQFLRAPPPSAPANSSASAPAASPDSVAATDGDNLVDTIRELTIAQAGGGAGGSVEADAALEAVVAAAVGHFEHCTSLLQKHVCSNRRVKLQCAIADFRPVEVDSRVPRAQLQHLTESRVIRHMVAGSHWTMLFGERVAPVASLLQGHIKELMDGAGAGAVSLFNSGGSPTPSPTTSVRVLGLGGQSQSLGVQILGAAVIDNHFDTPLRSVSADRLAFGRPRGGSNSSRDGNSSFDRDTGGSSQKRSLSAGL